MKKNNSREDTRAVIELMGRRLLYSADSLISEIASAPDEDNKHQQYSYSLLDYAVENDQDTKEVILLNSNVHDLDLFIKEIESTNREAHVIILDVEDHSIEDVNRILNRYQNLEAIHLIGHGGPDSFQLGAEEINGEFLLSQQSNLEPWSEVLSQNGAVHLYACDVAAAGTDFVDSLSEIIQRNVIASNNSSGSTELGGDWVLEYQSTDGLQKPLFDPSFADQYSAILAPNTAPTFDVADGMLLQNNSGAIDLIRDGVVQADGKILVAGYVNDNDWDYLITRYNNDGTIDSSFGTDGVVRLDLGSGREQSNAIAVQNDGKIIVVGSREGLNSIGTGYTEDFSVVRLLSDGSLDTTFAGGSGQLQADFGDSNDFARDVLALPDGSIVVVGEAGADVGVLKINSDGTLDSSFGSGGKLTLDISGNQDQAKGISLLADGSLLIVGHSFNSSYDLMMVNLAQDGSVGPNFQSIQSDFGTGTNNSTEAFYSVVQQPDGKLLVAGSSTANSGNYDMTLARYNLDGSLDLSFGGTGHVSVPAGPGSDYAKDLKVLNDGSIIAAGWIANDFSVVKYTSTGALDVSFANNGIYKSPIGGYSVAESVEILADGSVIVIGHHSENTDSNTLIFKLKPNGELDTSFAPKSTIDDTPTYIENSPPIRLDSSVDIVDAELDSLNGGLGNYSGSSLTLERLGGASTEDVFQLGSAVLLKNGQAIALVDTSQDGRLLINFTDANGEIPNSQDVDSILSQIFYSNNSDTPPGEVTLEWTFSDGNNGAQGSGGSGVVVEQSTVKITAVDDLPSNTGQPIADVTASLNRDYPLDLSSIEYSDVDYSGELVRVLLDSSNGQFSGEPASGVSVQVFGSSIIVNGSMSDINAYLDTSGNIKYNGSALGSDTINVSFIVGSNSVNVDSFVVSVVENTAPTISLPNSLDIIEDSSSNSVIGVVIADDIANGLMQITLTTSQGNIGFSSLANLTVQSGSNNSTSIILEGNLTDINIALQSLSYTPAADASGVNADILNISVNDLGSGGGAAQTSSDQIDINITAENDAPTTSGSYDSVLNLQEGQTVNVDFSGLVISDVDDENVSVLLILRDGGMLNFNNDSNVTTDFVAGSSTYTISGTIANINNFLSISNSIQYSHSDLNLHGSNVDKISVQLVDTDPVGGQGLTVVLDAIDVNIQAVNDPPIIIGPSAFSMDEDSVLSVSGIQISDNDAGTSPVSVVLEVNEGSLAIAQGNGLSINAETLTNPDGNAFFRLTVSGSIDDINVSLPTLTYTPNENHSGLAADSIKLQVNDQGNSGGPANTTSKIINVDINPAPDPAVNTGVVPAVLLAIEDLLSPLNLNSLNFQDPDQDVNSSIYTLRLSVSANGSLTVASAAGLTVQNNGTSEVEITGNLADLNQFIDDNSSIQYQHSIDNTNGTSVDQLLVTLEQISSDNLAVEQIANIDIDISAVNDSPGLTTPSQILVAEGQSVAIAGLSIADVDSGSAEMAVKLGVNSGSLFIGQSAGVNITSLTFTNTNGVTVNGFEISGSQSNINQALATLSYTAANNSGNTDDELSVIVDDQGNSGGPAIQVGEVVSIDITPQAIDLTNIGTLPARLQVTEDTFSPLDLSTVELQDNDNSATTYQLVISSNNGELQINNASGLTVNSTGLNTVQLSGSLEDLNTWLNSSNGLLYQHSVADQFGDAADSLSLSVSEGPSFSPAFSLGAVVIDIDGVNDLASLSTPTSITVIEDSSESITGIVLTDVDGDRFQLTLESQQGDVRIAGLSPALLVGGSNASGLLILEGSLTDIQQALSNLYYDSPPNLAGSQADRIDLQLNEVNAGVVENVLSNSIDIDITAQNDAPTIVLPNQFSATEGQSVLLTGITIADIDVANGDLILRLGVVSGNLSAGQTTGLTTNSVTFTNSNGDTVSGVELVGRLSDLNQALNSISYSNASNGSDLLTVVVNDQGNSGGLAQESSAEANITVDVQATNPVNTGILPTRLQVTEDTFSPLDLSTVELQDNDNSATTYRLVISSNNGELQINNASGLTVNSTGLNTVQLSGSLEDLNTWLNSSNGLLYQHSVADQFGDAADSLSLSVSEGPSFSPAFSLGSVVIDIDGVNDLASLSTPTSITVIEDGSQGIAGIVLTDVDGDRYRLTIESQQGNVRVEGLTPALLVGGSNASELLILEGNLTDIQQALNNLYYDSPSNVSGSQADRIDLQLNEVNAGVTENVLNNSIDVDITPNISEPTSENMVVDTLEDEPYVFTVNDFPFNGKFGDNLVGVEVDISLIKGRMFLNGESLIDKQTISAEQIESGLLVYVPEPDHNGSNYESLKFRLIGEDSFWSPSYDLNINIIAVNDNPVNIGNTAATLQGASGSWLSVDLGNIRIDDVDASDENLELRIELSINVDIELSNSSNVKIIDQRDNQLLISGTLEELNGFLDTADAIKIRSLEHGEESLTLAVYVHDKGNSGIGASDWVLLSESNVKLLSQPNLFVLDEAEPDQRYPKNIDDSSYPFKPINEIPTDNDEEGNRVIQSPKNSYSDSGEHYGGVNLDDIANVISEVSVVGDANVLRDGHQDEQQSLLKKLQFSNELSKTPQGYQNSSYQLMDDSGSDRSGDKGNTEKELNNKEIGKVGVVVAAAASISLLLWLSRIGSLLAAFISIRPLWSDFDPLPVLSRAKSKTNNSSAGSNGDADGDQGRDDEVEDSHANR